MDIYFSTCPEFSYFPCFIASGWLMVVRRNQRDKDPIMTSFKVAICISYPLLSDGLVQTLRLTTTNTYVVTVSGESGSSLAGCFWLAVSQEVEVKLSVRDAAISGFDQVMIYFKVTHVAVSWPQKNLLQGHSHSGQQLACLNSSYVGFSIGCLSGPTTWQLASLV